MEPVNKPLHKYAKGIKKAAENGSLRALIWKT